MDGRSVIMFEGGEGGALLSSARGVHALAPFSPSIRRCLAAASHLIHAATSERDEEAARQIAREAASLTNMAIAQVEQVVGPLDEERALIYQAEGGGFTCGSVGKPPIPLPWPVPERVSITDLVRSGVVDDGIIELVRKARAEKIDLREIFAQPERMAAKLGVTLSEQSVTHLGVLAPDKLAAIPDETDREVVALFHKVLEDGRYVDTWHTRPYAIAHQLDVTISEAALERVVAGGARGAFLHYGPPGGEVMSVIAAGVIVAGVAIAVGIVGEVAAQHVEDLDKLVIDRSNLAKF